MINAQMNTKRRIFEILPKIFLLRTQKNQKHSCFGYLLSSKFCPSVGCKIKILPIPFTARMSERSLVIGQNTVVKLQGEVVKGCEEL